MLRRLRCILLIAFVWCIANMWSSGMLLSCWEFRHGRSHLPMQEYNLVLDIPPRANMRKHKSFGKTPLQPTFAVLISKQPLLKHVIVNMLEAMMNSQLVFLFEILPQSYANVYWNDSDVSKVQGEKLCMTCKFQKPLRQDRNLRVDDACENLPVTWQFEAQDSYIS